MAGSTSHGSEEITGFNQISNQDFKNLLPLGHGWGSVCFEGGNWTPQCVGTLNTLCDKCKLLGDLLAHLLLTAQPDCHRLDLGTVNEVSAREGLCYCCRAMSWLLEKHNVPLVDKVYLQLSLWNVVDLALYLFHETLKRSDSGEVLPTETVIRLRPMTPIMENESLMRPYDPRRFSLTRIKDWINHCERDHNTYCEHDHKVPLEPKGSSLAPLEEIFLIDLENKCVVTASFETRYVALSYVWGGSFAVLATKENLSALQKPGSLEEGNEKFPLPQTIRDAMSLALLLGETKLWVDSLCIIQDEGELKQRFLKAMASIYANAYFTIVAVEGTNADHGIHGISNDRNVPCIVLDLPQTPMMVQYEHFYSGYPHKSKWATRGWTFQESVFSKRLLVMDKLASWICGKTTFLEEFEDLKSRQYLYPDAFKETCAFYNSVTEKSTLSGWAGLVGQFNTRDLTYENDILSAFAGITTVMSEALPGGIHHGIPVKWFEIGLLWCPSGKSGRRFAMDVDGKPLPLPSWSWLSYPWSLDLETWELDWDGIEDLEHLKLIHVVPSVEWRMCETASINAEELQRPLSFAEHIQYRDRLPLSTLLRFRTEQARISIATGILPPDNAPRTKILDNKNRCIGVIVAAPPASSDGELWQTVESIAISHTRVHKDAYLSLDWDIEAWYSNIGLPPEEVEWFDLVNILWVEWEDGVAYRKALGRIVKSAWEKLDLDIVDIVLG